MQLGRRRRISQIESQHTVGSGRHREVIPAALRFIRLLDLLGRHRTAARGNAHQTAAVAVPEIDLIEQRTALHEPFSSGIGEDRPARDIRNDGRLAAQVVAVHDLLRTVVIEHRRDLRPADQLADAQRVVEPQRIKQIPGIGKLPA